MLGFITPLRPALFLGCPIKLKPSTYSLKIYLVLHPEGWRLATHVLETHSRPASGAIASTKILALEISLQVPGQCQIYGIFKRW